MARIKDITVKIIALKRRQRKDGSIPLYLRVTHSRDYKIYSLKMSVTEKEFDNHQGRYKRNREGNFALDSERTRAEGIIDEIRKTEGGFTFDRFENKFFERQSKHTAFSFIQMLVDDFELEGRIGTARPYKNVLSELKKFTKGKSKRFEDITYPFLERFERSLRSKGVNQTSISIYLRSLRAAYNKAIKEGIVKQECYPFRQFTIRNGSSEKISLDKNDMVRLMNYRADDPDVQDSLNYFNLSYLCRGMNFTDMCKLTWENNYTGDRIVYQRQKTVRTNKSPRPTRIEVKDSIARIIEQYAANEPYILPVLERGLTEKTIRHRVHGRLKKITKDVRKVATELNIPNANKITYYVARHTYATVLKFGKVSVDEISESLGHSSVNTTKSYLRSFGDEVLDKNDELLT